MTISCTSCGGAAALLFRTRDLNRAISRERFSYYRCSCCGLIFLCPVPTDLGAYYPPDYYAVPKSLDEVARAAELERYKVEIVKRFRSGGRLLEIGPAYGAFVHLAKQAGFEANAIEMSPECCRFLRDVLGVSAVQSDDPAAALVQLAPFDVIALWHVIEHLADPWTLLRTIAEKLTPGGILVIAAPNPSALQFKVTGGRWPHVDAPRHVALIPPTLLAQRAEALGLTQTWLTTCDAGSLGWNVFGWERFFMNMWKARFVTFGLRIVGKLFGTLMSPFERTEGIGSAYTIVFTRAHRT